MKIISAKAMGICPGVRRVLEMVQEIENPQEIAIYGELVHNEEVNRELVAQGYAMIPEMGREIPSDYQTLLVTPHGISNRERHRLRKSGKQLIDGTCPMVRRIHELALQWQKSGYYVLVIGKQEHIEVQGITGDLRDYAVIKSTDEVRNYGREKLGVLCQSTACPDKVKIILEEIRSLNPESEIEFVDTICSPTRERQQAVLDLLPLVEALIVVGGRNSNNTRQLVRLAEERNIPVRLIQTSKDIDQEWLENYSTIGLTAGASTRKETIYDVYTCLEAIRMKRERIIQNVTSEKSSSAAMFL